MIEGLSPAFYQGFFNYTHAIDPQPYEEIFIAFDFDWNLGDNMNYEKAKMLEKQFKDHIIETYLALDEHFTYSVKHEKLAHFASTMSSSFQAAYYEEKLIGAWKELSHTGMYKVSLVLNEGHTKLHVCELQRPGKSKCAIARYANFYKPLPDNVVDIFLTTAKYTNRWIAEDVERRMGYQKKLASNK